MHGAPTARRDGNEGLFPARAIDPRVVAQVCELHDEVARLTEAAGRFTRGSARRELRDARTAETDLLRALGFQHFEQFARAAGIDLDAPRDDPSEPSDDAVDVVDADAGATEVAEATEATTPPAIAPPAIAPPAGAAPAGAAPDVERWVDDGPDPASVDRVVEELAGLRQRMIAMEAELRALREVHDAGLSDLRAFMETAELNVAQLRAAAFAEADRIRDEAKQSAQEILDEATAEANAIRRDALATADGLRAIAEDDETR